MSVTLTEISDLQVEFYRSRAIDLPAIRTPVAVMVLVGAWKHISRRRDKGSSEARKLLREALRRVLVGEFDVMKAELDFWKGVN